MEKKFVIELTETEALVLKKAMMFAITHANENADRLGQNADIVIDQVWYNTIKAQLMAQDLDLKQKVDLDKIYEEM